MTANHNSTNSLIGVKPVNAVQARSALPAKIVKKNFRYDNNM